MAEMAGSTTNGIKNRKANTDKMAEVPDEKKKKRIKTLFDNNFDTFDKELYENKNYLGTTMYKIWLSLINP